MKSQLPPVSVLRRRCQSLAALDLILSPDWEYRYYSFNSQWSPGQQMASMRNGCGDEWFCLFHQDGWAGLKGLAHESEAWRKSGRELSLALQRLVPAGLSEFSSEPAFRWDASTFAFYTMGEMSPWVRLNDSTKYSTLETGESEFLGLLDSQPDAYVQYASEYFEIDVDIEVVRHVFQHRAITGELLAKLNRDIGIQEIAAQLFEEIGYPE